MTTNAPPPGRRITAAEVARAAGVSRSAVSRAFTEGAYLDSEKRDLILTTARALGYRPNALAAGLQGGRSNLVAIFSGQSSNDLDRDAAARLVSGLNAIGRWPIMIDGSGDSAREAVANVLRYPLEAMILRAGSMRDDIVADCVKLAIPVISWGRVVTAPQVDSVCLRNDDGMATATQLLLDKGRRRFGFVGGPKGFSSADQRRAGFERVLQSHGLAPLADLQGDFTYLSGYNAAQSLIGVGLDALICANDAMALGALQALQNRGIEVPQALSVIGFDDIPTASWPGFELTTLRNPIDALVAAVTGLIERRAAHPAKQDEQIWLKPDLMLRATH